MGALRRLFELIVLASLGVFVLCAGHVESAGTTRERAFANVPVCTVLALVGAVTQARGRQGLR